MEQMQEACSTGDSRQRETLLSDPTNITVTLDREPVHENKLVPRRPNMMLLLQSAAGSEHLTCVRTLLKFGHDDERPYDALITRWEDFAALRSGENAILKYFIETWPDVVHLKMGHAGQPLMQTLIKDSFELSAYLLGHGADANAIGGPDKTPGYHLRLAAKNLTLQYTIMLLKHGAQVAQRCTDGCGERVARRPGYLD